MYCISVGKRSKTTNLIWLFIWNGIEHSGTYGNVCFLIETNLLFVGGNKMDKCWMTVKKRIKSKEYRSGVKSFIEFAMANVGLGVDIWCPCVNCMNAKKQGTEVVKIHMILRGISISYKTWVQHGESVPAHRLCVSNEDACFHSKSSRDSVEGNNIKDGEELPNMVGEVYSGLLLNL